jgi:hypothetical protein
MSLKKKKRYTDELIIHYIGRGREMSLKKKKQNTNHMNLNEDYLT